MRWIMSVMLLGLCSPAPAMAQENLLGDELRDLLHEALSGELAKEHVIAITRHHRIQGSRGYRDAARYVLSELHAHGFDESRAWIDSYPSDGKVVYQTWQSPSGWQIDEGELVLLEPVRERIVGYPEIAMSVITYSNPGEVTAELVDVGAGTSDSDYEGRDVAGKFVLATGYGGAVHRLAVLKYGAAAVVCYLDDSRARDYPDMLAYTGMWPKTDELERTTFGFNLTYRQGAKLRDLLKAGQPVVLQGSVKGVGLEPFFMDVVSAVIPGSERPDEELIFSAHLDHPKESANDNASGSGAILDIAITLRRLIDSGRMQQPKRSLRFLWVPEWNGTMAWIDAHEQAVGPELGGQILANMNLDMVGEHLELLHSKLILTRTPASLPSAVNVVVENMAGMVDGLDVRTPRGSRSAFNYRVTPFSGGSDHMMFLDRKIPAVMFSHAPDYTHHTSEDTPDKVDPVQLERCEILAAAALLYLSDLTEPQAMQLLQRVAARGSEQMLRATEKARSMEDPRLGRSVLHTAYLNQRAELDSVLHFQSGQSAKVTRDWLVKRLESEYEVLLEVLPPDPAALRGDPDPRVPVRLTRGPLDFGLPESGLSAERRAWYAQHGATYSGDFRFELVNFIDGRRTVSEIHQQLVAEFDPMALERVAHYLDDLVRVGVVRWN